MVSHSNPGEANIDKEIFSKENDQFVLHDSQGFEPGEIDTMETVENFIRRRDAMSAVKDKLHAVWYAIKLCRFLPFR